MDTVDRNMFYGAKPEIFERAVYLRNNMTWHELVLWDKLQSKKLMGYRFKPQHPINIFIADFYCHKLKLVVEIDGDIHKEQKEYDEGREHEMEEFGIKTIRFSNKEVESNIDSVIENIALVIKEIEIKTKG